MNSVFEYWMCKGESLLSQNKASLLETASVAVGRRKEKRPRSLSPLLKAPSEKRARNSLNPSALRLKPSLPDPGLFVYEKSAKKITVIKLTEAQLSWCREGGTSVSLDNTPRVSSTRTTKDSEHLKLQTQVLFGHFLRGHCSSVPERVCTPTRLLVSLFQRHCLAAGVPAAEVADAVVTEYVEKYCREKYECVERNKATCVVGLAVFRDSPLYSLWRSKAVAPQGKRERSGARGEEAKSSFTKCILVHPRDAVSGIKHFATDAGENTTMAKFVPREVALSLQRRYCHDHRELNRMEFGHVMCKANRGIETKRPQCRIRPSSGTSKQEYHYSRVEPRATPLLSRGALDAAIQKRGFRLPLHMKHHLMRQAQLHTSFCSDKLY